MEHVLVVALGNPGEKFKNTRHNLGQDIVLSWVELARERGADVQVVQSKESLHARIQEVVFNNIKITILYPDVFMNESGKAVMQYLRYNEVDHKNILIVHDDLELPLSEVKLQESGSAKGHNGVRSIHEYLGTLEVPRLRIGIGRPADQKPIDVFVLEKFTEQERMIFDSKKQGVLDAITEAITAPGLIRR
ncbi:MAG: aminoacyl-tRNA hydrolase [Candidatus Andersenbacteria bacterium]|nr:aminoacyl-tRNA hydrolase [Candidatus Andersenbacteria bacterium]